MFHFLSALSSGEYITSFTGLAMSKGGLCSSTANGYHFLACAYAAKLASASAAPATIAPVAIADRFIPPSCIFSVSRLIRPLPRLLPQNQKNIIPPEFSECQFHQLQLDGISRGIAENDGIGLFARRRVERRKFARRAHVLSAVVNIQDQVVGSRENAGRVQYQAVSAGARQGSSAAAVLLCIGRSMPAGLAGEPRPPTCDE